MSKAEQSRKAYNKKARNYEGTMDGRVTRPLKQLMISKIKVENGQRVLDVACGTGDLITALDKKADIQAYGIDISEQMIEVAQSANRKISYAISPAYPLPFDDSYIDIITVSAAFHHFEEPMRFADECKRVLRNAGRLYIGEFHYPSVVRVILNPILPLLKSGDVKLYSIKELSSIFQKAGFDALDVERVGQCMVLSFMKKEEQ